MRYFTFLFCFFYALIGIAKKPIVLSEDFKPLYIGTHCEIYEDPTNLEAIQVVKKKKEQCWILQDRPKILGAISRSNFWAKFQIENPRNEKMEVAIAVENPDLDKVQFFGFEQEILVDSSQLMGDIYPFVNREINHRFFIHRLIIGPKSTLDVYCLFGKKGGKMIFNTKLLLADQLIASLQRDTIKVWSLQVMVGLAILVGCLFFLLSRESVAFYYMLLNIIFLFWLLSKSGIGFQYLWPNTALVQQGSSVLSFSLYSLFQTIMIRALLGIKNKTVTGRLFIAAIIVQVLGILMLLSPLVIKLQDSGMHYKLIAYVTHTASLLNVLLTFLGGLIYLLQRGTFRISIIFMIYILQIIFFVSWLTSFPYIADTYILTVVLWSIQNITILFLLIQDYFNKTKQNRVLQLQFAQKQNEAFQNLLVGQEEERKRLSQELHDGLSIRIAQVKQLLSINKQKGISQQAIPKIIADIDNIHQDVRHFSHALNPVVLEQLGFKKAIDNLIFNLENTYVDLDIQFNFPSTITLSPEQEKHFYHILQELLNNTIKYAQADSILIHFEHTTKQLLCRYEDNGIGFELANIQTGIGLQNIQSRVELLKGIFKSEKITPVGMRQSICILN